MSIRWVMWWSATAALLMLLAAPTPTPTGQLAGLAGLTALGGLAGLAVVGFLALRGFTLPTVGALRPGVVAGVRRRRATHQAALRLHDPDAPGRARPRAPGTGPAA